MSKIHTTIRVDKDNYEEAREILNRLGLSFSQAINIFVALIKENQGLSFEVKIPNQKTLNVIQEAREGRNMLEFESLEELKEFLEN